MIAIPLYQILQTRYPVILDIVVYRQATLLHKIISINLVVQIVLLAKYFTIYVISVIFQFVSQCSHIQPPGHNQLVNDKQLCVRMHLMQRLMQFLIVHWGRIPCVLMLIVRVDKKN